MNRSNSLVSAFALAASYLVLTAMPCAAATHSAVASIPDSRILSAAPFQFQSDRAIVSEAPKKPIDSRIFTTPHDSAPFWDGVRFSQEINHKKLI